MKKGIAILGSTGSIGTQALDVVSDNPEMYSVELLAAKSNYKLLFEQAVKHNANAVYIEDQSAFDKIEKELWAKGIKCYTGQNVLSDLVSMTDIEVVLTSMVGAAGLLPTIAAIEAGKHIA